MRTLKEIGKDEQRRRAQLEGFQADVEQARRDIAEITDARRPLLLPSSEGDADATARLSDLTDRLQDARQRAEDGVELIAQCEAAIKALEDERAAVEREAHYDKVRVLVPRRLELAEQIEASAAALVRLVREHSEIKLAMSEAIRATGDHDGANAIANSDALDRWLTSTLGILRQRPVRVLRTLDLPEHSARLPFLDAERATLAPYTTNDAAKVAA